LEVIWQKIVAEAKVAALAEPLLAPYFAKSILNHQNLGAALSAQLCSKLASSAATEDMLGDVLRPIFADKNLLIKAAKDIEATVDRDSACTLHSTVLLYFKGFLSLQAYRAAHALWLEGRTSLALLLQHRTSLSFAVDIHPAAEIGCGIMIDHATGLVVGETAVIEDAVSIMQLVTLGGTGKDGGDRHPKIRKGALIGPGATVLGNIEVGEGAMVSAASVVLKDVNAHTVVAGVPATQIGTLETDFAAKQMNQWLIK
jgi:serine O-acetyltransferase